jgi:hypothetical protein
MASPERFELPTAWFVALRVIPAETFNPFSQNILGSVPEMGTDMIVLEYEAQAR